jgi:hypothetical protein
MNIHIYILTYIHIYICIYIPKEDKMIEYPLLLSLISILTPNISFIFPRQNSEQSLSSLNENMYTYVYIYVSIYITCTHMYKYMYIHIYENIYIHIYMNTYIHTYIYAHINICIFINHVYQVSAAFQEAAVTILLTELSIILLIHLGVISPIYVCMNVYGCMYVYF